VIRLRDIGPNVYAVVADTNTRMPCDTNPKHGRGMCFVVTADGQDADVLCLACAVKLIEQALGRLVTVAVTR
jgi:hypothetical protein